MTQDQIDHMTQDILSAIADECIKAALSTDIVVLVRPKVRSIVAKWNSAA